MSAQERYGLTLEGIAHRLEVLERENERMRSENDVLRSKVATMEVSGTRRSELPALRGSDTGRAGESERKFDGKVSRRAMLSKAGAAAVAVAAAGTLLNPREAKANHVTGSNTHSPYVIANLVNTHNLVAENEGNRRTAAVYGRSTENQGPGVQGLSSATGYGGVRVEHEGREGVGVEGRGRGQQGAGLRGFCDDGSGVEGQSNCGHGGFLEAMRSVSQGKAMPVSGGFFRAVRRRYV